MADRDSHFDSDSPSGDFRWKKKLDGRVIQAAVGEKSIVAVTDNNSVYSFNNSGEVNWNNSEISSVEDAVSVILFSGTVKVVSGNGTITDIGGDGSVLSSIRGPSTEGYTSVDEKGSLYLYGTDKKLYRYYNKIFTGIETGTSMTPPLLGAAGNLVSGGENWVVYCYNTPPSALGWSGYRGGPSRNGALEGHSGLKNLEKQYMSYRGYQYFKLMTESTDIDNRLNILRDFEKLQDSGELIEKFPFAPIILISMAEEGI
ncbi:MAG: hypothetical protein GY786_00135, partial [Proteobacteria bacterium]|nr:hypothetical protein [Pseudomonadota bacterium]